MGKAEDLKKLAGNVSASIGTAGAPSRPLPPRREIDPRHVGVTRSQKGFELEIDQLIPDPDQPRKEFDEALLDKLGSSLEKRGQLMPVLARFSQSHKKWMIVDGERRYRAAKMRGIPRLNVMESTKTDGTDILMDQVVTALLREDLKPSEKASAYKQIMENNGWDGKRLAQELDISPGQVTQVTAIDNLPEEIKAKVDEGVITASAGYEVSRIDDPVMQSEVVGRIVDEKMNRQEVRDVVAEAVAESNPRRSTPGARKPGRQVNTDQVWRTKVDGYAIQVEKKRGFNHRSVVLALRQAAAELEAKQAVSI